MLIPNQLILNKTRRHDILEYYRAKGYEVNTTGFYVRAEDLNPKSALNVRVICDYCKKEYTMPFRYYFSNVLNGNIQKCACKDCDHLKYEESMMKRYGTLQFGMSEESKNKRKNTCLQKYGVENPMNVDEINKKQHESYKRNNGYNSSFEKPEVRNKIQKTFNQKYGVDYPLQSKEIQLKAKATFFDKYETDTPLGNAQIREKIKATCLSRYGSTEPLKSDIIQNKISQTRFNTQSCKSSVAQRHLCDLFHGLLNYSIVRFNVDILLENNIVLEYDGGAHDLAVKHKTISYEQFLEKEEMRENYIIEHGYKIIRFQNFTDLSIEDNTYINVLEACMKHLKSCNIIKYDFNKMCFV